MSDRPAGLTHAESARTILARCRTGALSTLALEPPGHPYGSLISYALDDRGNPLMLISALAEHTRNLDADARASLLVTDGLRGDDPLADGRVSVLGAVADVPEDALADARARYLEAHPEASLYINFKDMRLVRLEVARVRYIGGFGRMSWIDPRPWREASPDPLYESAAGIIGHMNEDHADALLLYARHQGQLAEATAATMVAVDRHGFDMRVETPEGPRRVRLGFEQESPGAGAVRRALVKMVAEAREALGEPPAPH